VPIFLRFAIINSLTAGRDFLKQEKAEDTAPKKKINYKTLILFVVEFVVLWMIFHYFIFIAIVPSSSMEPTIPKHSLGLVTYLHGEKEVQRGDCVVFWSDEFDERLVKRVVGLPGEEVVVDSNGKVYIDGVPLKEDYVKNQEAVEREFNIPEGCYLFFGDNRANSSDARWWEDPYIPSEKLIGKVQFVLWASYLGKQEKAE